MATAPLDALVRAAERFAVEPDADAVLAQLMQEAVALFTDGGCVVQRWDPASGMLVAVASTLPVGVQVPHERPGQGVSGQAFQQRKTVVATNSGPAGQQALVAATPLQNEGRILGTLSVGSYSRLGRGYTPEELGTLEVLASLAAATLIGIERQQLHGVLLAANTLQHHLNNQLAVVVGFLELLNADQNLPPSTVQYIQEAYQGARSAAETLTRLVQTTRLNEIQQPGLPPILSL